MPRVLYIEDNKDNRLLVRRVLLASDYSFELIEAESAHKGIELAQANPPDLILMDLSMPEMDGLTATAAIRKIAALNRTPVIALTANAMTGDKERSLNAGCDGYISKPIDIDRFPNEVYAFYGTRSSLSIDPIPDVKVAEQTASEQAAIVEKDTPAEKDVPAHEASADEKVVAGKANAVIADKDATAEWAVAAPAAVAENGAIPEKDPTAETSAPVSKDAPSEVTHGMSNGKPAAE